MILKIFTNFMVFCHKVTDLLNNKKSVHIISYMFGMPWAYKIYNFIEEHHQISSNN